MTMGIRDIDQTAPIKRRRAIIKTTQPARAGAGRGKSEIFGIDTMRFRNPAIHRHLQIDGKCPSASAGPSGHRVSVTRRWRVALAGSACEKASIWAENKRAAAR